MAYRCELTIRKVKLWLYLLGTPDQGICKLRTFASPRPQPPLVSLQPHVSKTSRSSQKGLPVWLGPLRQVPEPSWWDATRRAAAESPAGMIGTELPPRVFPTDPSAPTCPEVRSDHYFVSFFCMHSVLPTMSIEKKRDADNPSRNGEPFLPEFFQGLNFSLKLLIIRT